MATTINAKGVLCIPSKGFGKDDLRKLRLSLGMTQKQFAYEFNFPLSTVISWENELRTPSPAAVAELQKIQQQTVAVVEVA